MGGVGIRSHRGMLFFPARGAAATQRPASLSNMNSNDSNDSNNNNRSNNNIKTNNNSNNQIYYNHNNSNYVNTNNSNSCDRASRSRARRRLKYYLNDYYQK